MATAGSRAHRRTGIETPEPDEYLREARNFCERSPDEQRAIVRKSEPMISEKAIANTGKSRRQWLRKRTRPLSNVGRPRKWVSSPLADWMIASKIRAEALAQELEVDLSTVYRWLRGDQLPTLKTAQAIAAIARAAGMNFTLDDVRIRCRMRSRSSLPPI
jgi:hypothetical protein